MGSSSSRPQTYDQYYQSLQNAPAASDENVDPYEVLGVRKNFEWEELTQAYRHMARLVHPDKGLHEEAQVRTRMFRIVTECFRKLAHEYKGRQEGRPHHELKKESQAYYASQTGGHNSFTPPPDRNESKSRTQNDESFIDRFNRTFEENALEDDENKIGYGGMMAKSSKEREEIAVPQVMKKFNADAFNSTFDKLTIPKTKDVIVYHEPEALPMGKKMAYTELGGGRPDDFSSTREGTGVRGQLDFTDYMKAHTTTRLVDPRAVKERKTYKTVDAYAADRTRVTAKPATPQELARRAQQENEQARAEEIRVARLRERDALAAAHHEKMNRLMLR
jgi:curved DNA-binding protein CbpA